MPSPCNCQATKHDFVTNCTSCGYILCFEDTNNKNETHKQSKKGKTLECPFCKSACYPPMTSDQLKNNPYNIEITEPMIKAYELKDRLLVYDMEHAKRTVIRDAQSDYYSSDLWLTEEEKQIIHEKERRRKQALQKRFNDKINIRFDIFGKRIVEANDDDDDDDDALRKDFNHDTNNNQIIVCKPELDLPDDNMERFQGGHYINALKSNNYEEPIENKQDESNDIENSLDYENFELEKKTTRAAELYRFMRQSLNQEETLAPPIERRFNKKNKNKQRIDDK